MGVLLSKLEVIRQENFQSTWRRQFSRQKVKIFGISKIVPSFHQPYFLLNPIRNRNGNCSKKQVRICQFKGCSSGYLIWKPSRKCTQQQYRKQIGKPAVRQILGQFLQPFACETHWRRNRSRGNICSKRSFV